jgi:hypothetical protein
LTIIQHYPLLNEKDRLQKNDSRPMYEATVI